VGDPDHAHLGVFVIPSLTVDVVYLASKFENYSIFNHSKDMNDDPKCENRGDLGCLWSLTLTGNGTI